MVLLCVRVCQLQHVAMFESKYKDTVASDKHFWESTERFINLSYTGQCMCVFVDLLSISAVCVCVCAMQVLVCT